MKYKFNGIKSSKRSGCSSCRRGRNTGVAMNTTSIVLSDGRVLHLKKGDTFSVNKMDVEMIEKMNKHSTGEVYSRVT